MAEKKIVSKFSLQTQKDKESPPFSLFVSLVVLPKTDTLSGTPSIFLMLMVKKTNTTLIYALTKVKK